MLLTHLPRASHYLLPLSITQHKMQPGSTSQGPLLLTTTNNTAANYNKQQAPTYASLPICPQWRTAGSDVKMSIDIKIGSGIEIRHDIEIGRDIEMPQCNQVLHMTANALPHAYHNMCRSDNSYHPAASQICLSLYLTQSCSCFIPLRICPLGITRIATRCFMSTICKYNTYLKAS